VRPDLEEFVESRKSSKAKRPKLKYRKGKISLVVPEGMDIDEEQIINDNREWVREHIKKAREFDDKIPERDLRPGGEISVFDERRKIVVEKRRSNEIRDNVYLSRHLVDRTDFMDQLEKALRQFARQKYEEKASMFIKEIDESYNKIFIRDQKTRWGSCSSNGNLNFNWRVVLGPEHVFDYIVVHELVHLEEMNHNQTFWNKVEQILPNYRRSKAWLRDESAKLVFGDRKQM